MVESNKESTVDTFLLAFYIRDCRGGKGERWLGRRCLIWLFINEPSFFSKVAHLIPEYGRWDDLLQFFPGVLDLSDIAHVRSNYVSTIPSEKHMVVLRTLQHQIVKIFSTKLQDDYISMINGKPCSLAAKWAPTECDSLDRVSGVYKLLADEMKVSTRDLRKKYITPLRSYLNIVECYMCDREWNEINYNNVPSGAMKRLVKSFNKHDAERFSEWKNTFNKHDNSNQLSPHKLIREMRTKGYSNDICNSKWNVIEDKCKKNGSFKNDIVVVDTSASMMSADYIYLDVACAIGLLVSRCSTGKFKNHVISFNTNPEFTILDKDASIYDNYRQIVSIDWGAAGIKETFELMLSRAKQYGLDIPKRIWIISDIQFNQLNNTNFEMIDKMYANSGYIRPQIIFWNVNDSSDDFPFSVGCYGTVLISGYSTSVIREVLYGDNIFSSYGIMRKILDSDRFLPIRKLFTDE